MRHFATLTAILALAAPAAVAQQSAGTATRDGDDIHLEGVSIDSAGYLVVTEEPEEGAAASDPAAIAQEPAAVAEVQPGENQSVRVPGDYVSGTTYVIRIYTETGDEEGFQWRDGYADRPVSEGGRLVTTTFDMMMEDGAPETDS
jgi:hypothetical protein